MRSSTDDRAVRNQKKGVFRYESPQQFGDKQRTTKRKIQNCNFLSMCALSLITPFTKILLSKYVSIPTLISKIH